MMSIISPAIAIANRMSFTAKLFSVVLIFLIPYVFVLGIEVSQSVKSIHQDEMQLDGVELILHLKPIALSVAQHRGNMAQYLAGATDKESKILAIEADIADAMAQLTQTAEKKHYESVAVKELTDKWQSLKLNNNRSAVGSKNFQAHSDFVDQIQHLKTEISNDFQLLLQDNSRNYYLLNASLFDIPELEEDFGRLRGKGASALTDKVVTPNERIEIGSILSTSERLSDSVNKNLQLLFRDPAIRSDFNDAAAAYHSAERAFYDLANNQLVMADDVVITNTNFFEVGTKVIDALIVFDKKIVAALQASIVKKHDAKLRRNIVFLVVAIAAIVSGLYFSMGILASLNANARTLNEASHSLGDGDFSTVITVNSEDTLGDAAKSLTGMIASVASLLNSIQQSAHEVNNLSVQLQAVADTSKQELDQQNIQTQQAASASTQMAATVREVARSCVEVSSATETARDSALEGQQKVKEAVAKINVLGTDVERAKDIIGELQSDVTNISAVLEVIRSIAEQTNLLALNAAIEAARAGEQGRGFAVVADEVRSLAKRTQDSTAEIRAVLETLQTRAANAVEIIHHSYVDAQESVVSAASAGQSLEKIVVGVESLSNLNTQIAAAAEQQAAVAEQMSRNTVHLSDSAENILGQVEKTVSYSSNLRRSALSLLENTMKFKT